jgi:hypothetical protein
MPVFTTDPASVCPAVSNESALFRQLILCPWWGTSYPEHVGDYCGKI